MAQIVSMWLNNGMRGRADKTSNTYVRVNRLTGKAHAVTLRHPRTWKDFSDKQITNSNRFGALCKGVHEWLKLAKSDDAAAEDRAEYEKLMDILRNQNTYPHLSALIMAKRYVSVNDTIDVATFTDEDYVQTLSITFDARPLNGKS
jgi:hypothetical protein